MLLEVSADPVEGLEGAGYEGLKRWGGWLGEETEIMQPDQACCDRGRPGTCTSLEYVVSDTPLPPLLPRLSLHPHLYLRSMSYIGHYLKEAVSFATPSIVIQAPLANLPPHLEADLSPDDSERHVSFRVWSFRACPPTINILSHGFVFQNDPKAKEHRTVQMGAYAVVGLSQRTLSVGRLLDKVRVSVHKSRGMMACSPNNAILNVTDPGVNDLRRFWLLIRDGTRVELTLNVLLAEDEDIDALNSVLQQVAALGERTRVGDLFDCLAKSRAAVAEKLLILMSSVFG